MIISFIRTIAVYSLIVISIRIMGKRQISELQTTELVVTLIISDLAVIPMEDSSQPLTSGIIPILVLIALELFISVFMLKSSKFRKLICGNPLILIDNGVVLQDVMTELRMSTEDLYVNLRQQNVFDLQEVQYAIVETNGTLSILKKTEYDTVQNRTLNLPVEKSELILVVISDGTVCQSSMQFCGLDKKFINETLQTENICLNDVYIMTSDKNRNYNIIRKQTNE